MGQLKHVEDASDSSNLLAFGQYIPEDEPTPLILGCLEGLCVCVCN